MYAATSKQMKSIDRAAIAAGTPSCELMERAGRAAADALETFATTRSLSSFVALCGAGLNGGDGFVAARLLRERGYRVMCLASPDGAANLECAEKRRLYERSGGMTSDKIELLSDFDVIVDAVFGTGLSRKVTGWAHDALSAAANAAKPIVAIDMPSTIHSDTGELLGPELFADETITFTLPKPAHFLACSYRYCGKLTVADIGIGEDATRAAKPYITVFDDELARRTLPKRAPDSHKGNYGRLLLVCGSQGFTGAPILASRAAVGSGAGLVWLAVPEPAYQIVAAGCLEAMPFPVPASDEGGYAATAADAIASRAKTCDIVLAGCGVTPDDGAVEVLRALLDTDKPLVLDAGMLSALSRITDGGSRIRMNGAPVILTPHDGELARLCGEAPERSGESRIDAARRIAAATGAILVMKGHRTITASPDGRTFINTTGNAGMARGGSGDLLAGLITSLAAQLPEPCAAAALAAYAHGRAGDIAAARYGQYGMTPGKMLDALGDVFKELEGR